MLKAVESAMGQQALLEVIVIDDGSTDGTAEELEKKFNHRGHNRASGQMRDGAIANWPEGRGSGRDRVKEHGGSSRALPGQAKRRCVFKSLYKQACTGF